MNNWKNIARIFLIVLSLAPLSSSAQLIKYIEYYIDDDPGFGSANEIKGYTKVNDIHDFSHSFKTSMSTGNHVVGIRSQDSLGRWSHTRHLHFRVVDSTVAASIKRLEFFVDSDPSFGKASKQHTTSGSDVYNHIFNTGVFSNSGNAIIGIRSQNSLGLWSHTHFLNIRVNEERTDTNVSTYEFYWDNDQGIGGNKQGWFSDTLDDISNHILKIPVDTMLSIGMHNLFFRTKGVKGAWSHTNLVGQQELLRLLNDTVEIRDTLTCLSYTTKNGLTVSRDTQFFESVIVKSFPDRAYQIYSYVLSFNNLKTIDLSIQSCKGFTSPSGRYYWDVPGEYYDTVFSTKGCDTLYKIDLNIVELNTDVLHIGDSLISNDLKAKYQWLDCANNYRPKVGETNRVFAVKLNGSYAVELSRESCKDTSVCLPITNLNIVEPNEVGIQVYPNPSSNGFYVLVANVDSELTCTLYNEIGQLVFTKKSRGSFQISGNKLSPGIYKLLIWAEGQLSSYTLITTH